MGSRDLSRSSPPPSTSPHDSPYYEHGRAHGMGGQVPTRPACLQLPPRRACLTLKASSGALLLWAFSSQMRTQGGGDAPADR